MDRHWLLTWTTYGTWLPGDARGFVSNVPGPFGLSVRHNRPDSSPEVDVPWMRSHARTLMAAQPVRLTHEQAEAVVTQLAETAAVRRWQLPAVAVMANHTHLVVAVPGDPEPEALLRDFKSYASRRLNLRFARQDRWWTEGGSTRKLPDEAAVGAAVEYVRGQEYALVVRVGGDKPTPGERPA